MVNVLPWMSIEKRCSASVANGTEFEIVRVFLKKSDFLSERVFSACQYGGVQSTQQYCCVKCTGKQLMCRAYLQ